MDNMTELEQATLALDTAKARNAEAHRAWRESIIALHRAQEQYNDVIAKVTTESPLAE